MNKLILHIVFIFSTFLIKGQENLVPNGNFEEYESCPIGFTDFTVTDWVLPTGGSSDYFNACNSSDVSVPTNLVGYQEARSGNAYCGFASGFDPPNENAREYLQTQLLSELIAGKEYLFTGFFSLADSSKYCIKNLGIVFSNDAIGGSFGTPISFSPVQVFPQNSSLCNTYDWVEVNIIYVAQGGEKYLTIGLFFDDINSERDLINPLIQDFGYYFVDDICVKEIIVGKIPNVLTPNNDGINDLWFFNAPSDTEVYIMNRWGNLVFYGIPHGNIVSWDGKTKEGNECTEGVYYYKVLNRTNIKTGFIQLIR